MILKNLPYPISVNAYYRNIVVNGRPRTLISSKGRQYKLDLFRRWLQISPLYWTPIDYEIELVVDLFPPDKRKRDIDNGLKSLLDSMEKAGVYVNDSQIKKLTVTIQKPVKDGRCDVVICSM